MKTPVLCVVGPTACGKSALALQLAQALDGEIINMDSMQIYRRMNIGTAKPSERERKLVRHHLIDIVEPTQSYSVADYARDADRAVREVHERGKLPMLVGGTGFYLRTLTDGLQLGGVRSDERLRASLKAIAEQPDGKLTLHERLRRIDPVTAEKLHPNDVQRVSRAIEVYELTGEPFSQQRSQPTDDCPYQLRKIGVTMERSALYRQIERRVDLMMNAGLADEVRALLESGVSPQTQSMQGIGYKELAPVFDGQATLADAVQRIKLNTRHYAKRQWTWFRADESVRWFDVAQAGFEREALQYAQEFENRGWTEA